ILVLAVHVGAQNGEGPAADDRLRIERTEIGPHHPVAYPDLVQRVTEDGGVEPLLHLRKKGGIVLSLLIHVSVSPIRRQLWPRPLRPARSEERREGKQGRA